jgi:glycosyltransferase involved in cell wall biosynthesis
MNRLLIISPDVVAEKMAGPGIRYWEMSRALAGHLDVTLAVPNQTDLAASKVRLETYSRSHASSLERLVADADVILFSGYLINHFPFLGEVSQPIVVDLYDPFILENLETHAHRAIQERTMAHQVDRAVLNKLLAVGDFFICASEKQRDFWLGALVANGRLNPHTYQDDKTFRELVNVIPFGIPAQSPTHTRQVLKGVYETIGTDDQVVLWGGGIWEWLDPLTLIQSMAEVVQLRPRAKLFFLGVRHPNVADVPEMGITGRAISLAESLGLLNTYVFFNDDWVPYAERQDYLLEADVGVTLHVDHAETHLSFRTRLLDYIWAGLPILTTRGDVMADLVERQGLGQVVASLNVGEVKEALLNLLDASPARLEAYKASAQKVAADLTWDQVMAPLVRFCEAPHLAADKEVGRAPSQPGSSKVWTYLLGQAWEAFRKGGPRGLYRSIAEYRRWTQSGRQ